MSKPYKEFEPAWVKEPAPKDSYRSVFRWGDPDFVKYPKESLYKMMKEKFGMTDEDFKAYDGDIGMDRVELNAPCRLAPEHIRAFKDIVGADFVTTDDYPRLAVAYGKPDMTRCGCARNALTACRMWWCIRIPRSR